MQMRGRTDEIEHARLCIDAMPGALTVAGDAGSGLTRFLSELSEHAESGDAIVLTAAGRRSEAHIDLALLRELAAHEPDGLLARGLTERGDTPEAVVLLDWASRTRPVILVIDDVQQADEASAAALDYLARRTGQTKVMVVLGSHHIAHDTNLELNALAESDLAAIVADQVDIDPLVAKKVASLADGSPLVAVEVAKSLTAAQRSGVDALPLFPVSAAPIRHAFDHAVRALPQPTRRALCLAAAEPLGEVRAIASALSELGGSLSDLDPAEEMGIIAIKNARVIFDHPIRRSVCYQLLAPASRRAAHRALAVALDAPQDAERRAAQLAAGFVEPNEQVAADLEFVARAAHKRGDVAEARRWWTRSSELSPDSSAAAERRERADQLRDAPADPVAGLTKAERRVAVVVGNGASNKDAATTLYVSVKTIDAHLQSIYRKLGIRSRTELAVVMARASTQGATS